MDVTPLIPEGRQIVEAYGNGGFRVSGQSFNGSVLVRPEGCQSWPVSRMAEVTVESLSPIWSEGDVPEVLLLGCGPKLVFLSAEIRRQVREAGPVLDFMDTGAACRTYNVLLSEGRRVAAALIAID